MPTDDPNEAARRCTAAQAAVEAHEASPATDETWEAWETELRRLTAARDQLCSGLDRATLEQPGR